MLSRITKNPDALTICNDVTYDKQQSPLYTVMHTFLLGISYLLKNKQCVVIQWSIIIFFIIIVIIMIILSWLLMVIIIIIIAIGIVIIDIIIVIISLPLSS